MTINEIFSTIRDWAVGKFQPKGNYAESADIPTKASQLQNDAGYISAIPDDYITETDLAGKGYLTSESDPTVPEWAKQPVKPQYTKAEIGLGDADNTSDMSKPVSTAQQAAIDGVYQQATGYTDQAIADLINGAPSTLDTLGEIAEAMQENNDVVDALEEAVGAKASQAELDGHIGNSTIHITVSERQAWNGKQTMTGDTKDNTVTFTSGDNANPQEWKDVELFASGERHTSLWHKVSQFAQNVRYLWKLLGNTSLSGIGNGTVTGAINALNANMVRVQSDQQEITVDVEQINITLPYKIKILICVYVDGYAPAIIDRYNHSITASNETIINVHFADIPNDKVRIRAVYVAMS